MWDEALMFSWLSFALRFTSSSSPIEDSFTFDCTSLISLRLAALNSSFQRYDNFMVGGMGAMLPERLCVSAPDSRGRVCRSALLL